MSLLLLSFSLPPPSRARKPRAGPGHIISTRHSIRSLREFVVPVGSVAFAIRRSGETVFTARPKGEPGSLARPARTRPPTSKWAKSLPPFVPLPPFTPAPVKSPPRRPISHPAQQIRGGGSKRTAHARTYGTHVHTLLLPAYFYTQGHAGRYLQ
ncbi:hypothetical protein GGR56DRAFT_442367 [Xylariaceae sp. FL0804]|nr:hypothetical protein GGR56DRAFT_442367 [Xylariaceae sp. FL0804]